MNTTPAPLETKYGLPSEVRFCKTCVISNQRPNSDIEYKHTKETKKKTIFFSEDGVCDACRMAEQKKNTINWDEREVQLRALCDRYRREDGGYDCLVPGSGGKDSFYAAHVLKYKYNMHPLTVTWAPHIYTDWGWKNQQSWIHAGFDKQRIEQPLPCLLRSVIGVGQNVHVWRGCFLRSHWRQTPTLTHNLKPQPGKKGQLKPTLRLVLSD